MNKKIIINIALFFISTIGIIGNAIVLYFMYALSNVEGPFSFINVISFILFILYLIINLFSLVNIFLNFFNDAKEEKKKE